MPHFDRGSWADFLRGLVDRDTGAEMSRHLDAGCRRCELAVAALSRVAEVAEADARLEISRGAIRSAKAIHPVRQADRLPAWRHLTLELIDGGAVAPAATGLRGLTDAQRFTYGGDGLELGLELDPACGSEHLTISGELLHRRRGHLAGVPAFLVNGQEVVDQGTTDELGSFRLGAEASSTRLCLFLDDDRLIELDLAADAELTGAWTVQPTRR